MPFENSLAHAFRVGSIRAHAPAAGGVYGISNSREWIFIGGSENIQSALIGHLNERDSLLARSHPTGFVFELVWPEWQVERCRRLIIEYSPLCNGARTEPPATRQSRFAKERW